MCKSSFAVVCAKFCIVFLLVLLAKSAAKASVIPALSETDMEPNQFVGQDQHYHFNNQLSSEAEALQNLPNSFALVSPEAFFEASFENGTSLLRGNMKRRFQRVKRNACKNRPENEVMEYYDLKLPNRCWEDCDCRPGRYCTQHSWCHDLPKH